MHSMHCIVDRAPVVCWDMCITFMNTSTLYVHVQCMVHCVHTLNMIPHQFMLVNYIQLHVQQQSLGGVSENIDAPVASAVVDTVKKGFVVLSESHKWGGWGDFMKHMCMYMYM